MIFNICPCPEGCVENQFAPFRVWGEQIDFPQKYHKIQILKYKFLDSF